jgi:UDP-glucose:(heptosyl)LPS alpha-1,3-glucosyltransferase
MNIALVIFHADPARGGAERYTIDLAAALLARGHRVSLLASSFGEAPGMPRDATLVELEAKGWSKVAQYDCFLDSLDAELESSRYEIVHAMLPVRQCDIYHPHAGIAAEAVESGHLKHDGGVKQAFSKLFNQVNRKRNRFAEVEDVLITGARPPTVLCLSEQMKAQVRQRFPPLPGSRIVTLFNSVNLKTLDPTRHPEKGQQVRKQMFGGSGDRVVALLVAQDFKRKGLREAIAALARTKYPRLSLLVVGKEDTTYYRQFAEALGVADRVVFAGPQSSVYDFYAASDFLVLPTHHDPCSLVVLEALAMVVPVISTKQNGATEAMTDGVHGFVINSADDQDALVHAMDELCNSGLRERMRRACLALRPKLSYDTHIATLEGVYQKAMERRKQAR